ncbi:MAG: hypothetical protein ACREC6_11515 [Hyphomicrobiaceae bacterium]
MDAGCWYADNTRESIRDETLQNGLVLVGAVGVLEDVPTTSSKSRYATQPDFAALFDPACSGDALGKAIDRWREANLTPSALMPDYPSWYAIVGDRIWTALRRCRTPAQVPD